MKRIIGLLTLLLGLLMVFVPGLYPFVSIWSRSRIRPHAIVLLIFAIVCGGLGYSLWHYATVEHWRMAWRVTSVIAVSLLTNIGVSHALDFRPHSMLPETTS